MYKRKNKYNSYIPVLTKSELKEMIKTKTQAQIAREVGVSREYIRQLVKKYGLFEEYRQLHRYIQKCYRCGAPLDKRTYSRAICDNCRLYKKYDVGHKCIVCGEETAPRKRWAGLCINCSHKVKYIKTIKKNKDCPNRLFLVEVKEKKELSIYKLADLFDVSVSTVGHWLVGRNGFSNERVKFLMEKFNM